MFVHDRNVGNSFSKQNDFSNLHNGDKTIDLDNSLTDLQWLTCLSSSNLLKREEQVRAAPSPQPLRSNKPPHSYTSLICMALEDSKEKRLAISEIYKWITTHFPYYESTGNLSWQNSVRHNLSLNKSFEKAPKRPSDSNKGRYWHLVPNYEIAVVHGELKPVLKRSLGLNPTLSMELESEIAISTIESKETPVRDDCVFLDSDSMNELLDRDYDCVSSPDSDCQLNFENEQNFDLFGQISEMDNGVINPNVLDVTGIDLLEDYAYHNLNQNGYNSNNYFEPLACDLSNEYGFSSCAKSNSFSDDPFFSSAVVF